ncbi:PepSY domain-containing protein [Sphingosinicella sp.]|uniref:PepSY domain-containing protein n=1 Tax=Sphingosinicella sp. TaxID=1917971 RepID=UPI00403824B8
MLNGIWAKIHKWLALLMALQILAWFASGLFFAWYPIERVRSEHMKAEAPAAPVALDAAASGLAALGREGVTGERVELRVLLGRTVALVTPREGRPRLYDLASGRAASPISALAAARIAEADHEGDLRAAQVIAVTANDSEYRAALPAWRVDFDDGEGRSIYVAADTGAVTARRSTLWRVYDFLWGLHIMDWRAHENFNSWLLVVTTVLGLIIVVSGIVLLPSRLGFTGWLRRKRAFRSTDRSI